MSERPSGVQARVSPARRAVKAAAAAAGSLAGRAVLACGTLAGA